MNKKGVKQILAHSTFFKNRRGQVTLFIIVSVLIVGIAVLFFTLKGGLKNQAAYSPEVILVKNIVDDCLDYSLEEIVFRIGEGGGYYNSGSVVSTPILEIPYYLKNNQNLMPSKEEIELEISKYVARDLVLCVGDFVLLPEYKVTKGKMVVKTTINPETVSVKLSYPLSIVKGDSVSKIEDFEAEIPVRLGIIYDSIFSFVEQEKETPGVECVSCLLDTLYENDLYGTTIYSDNNTKLIIIGDFNSQINKKDFIYNFADEFK